MNAVLRPGTQADVPHIARTLSLAYADLFIALTRDTDAVARGIEPMLHPARFLVAQYPDREGLAGVLGISDESDYAITIKVAALTGLMGFVKGNVAAAALREMFYRPARFAPGQAHISFLAVDESARGQGLATALVRRLLDERPHVSAYVPQGSEHVVRLFERLGFRMTGREREKNAGLKGYTFSYHLILGAQDIQ